MSVNSPSRPTSPFEAVTGYVSKLRALSTESEGRADWEQRCFAALNGEASKEVRRAASIEIRRKFGAFFTGSSLSEKLIQRGKSSYANAVFYDPTCGMGDLLLAAAKRLSLAATLDQTFKVWGEKLAGTDLHQEFIEGAKFRLMLLARQRHGISSGFDSIDALKLFPLIRVGNGLTELAMFGRATYLLMNPPFGAVATPAGCTWAGGRITEAATFVVSALEQAQAGTEVLAILPEVLRSGSFSEKWRDRVSELAEVHLVEPYGIFDETADVDVFLLRLVRRPETTDLNLMKWPVATPKALTTVDSFFDVHVGRVVPHRDKKRGPRYPYIHPRCVPTWKIMRKFTETRKHEGLVYKAPFVVIRRTSRPGHPYRATATIIGGKSSVAVENHLIVCEPKDGKLATCKKLMAALKTEETNKYLNERIRCRHLTVGAVSDIPFTKPTT